MRCFDKTINNVFYGTREVVEYDDDGQIEIVDGAIVLTKECVSGSMNSEGFVILLFLCKLWKHTKM